MGIIQTDPCQSCRYPMMVARTGLPLFRSAKGRRLRLFLRSRDNSVRETNAQPAPATGLFTGVGVRPQRAKMDFQRSCWKSILSICGNKCTAREVAKLSPHNLLQAPFMFDNLSNTANILFIHSGGVLQFCIRDTTTAQ